MPRMTLPVFDRSHLDNSILEQVGRCPRLAMYNYWYCRASRGTQNYPINFGVAYHDFRDTLEKLYGKWVVEEGALLDVVKPILYTTALSKATSDWVDPPLEHRKGYLDLGRLRKSTDEAFDSWCREKQLGYYKIIASETPFSLPLPSGRQFAGRLDQILEWNGQLWIRDFKTVGRKEDWKEKFNPAHQFSGYVWAAEQLSGRRIAGVIVDVVYNIKTKGPEFHPTLANRSSSDIASWLEWVEFEYDNWERYIEKDVWPMRTSACGDYGGCFFRGACNSGSNWNSIERWLTDKTIYSVWDPLNPEREEGLPE